MAIDTDHDFGVDLELIQILKRLETILLSARTSSLQQRFSPPDGQLLRQSYNLLFVFQHQGTRTITTTWPGALRQNRPSQVIAAGVPKKEVFAKAVAVTSKLCDRVQVARRCTPAHHALQVVRAVSVGEAVQEVAAVQAESFQDVPSVLVSEAFQLWRVAV